MRFASSVGSIVLSTSLLSQVAGMPLDAGRPPCAELPVETGLAPAATDDAGAALDVVTLNTARKTDVAHILKDVGGVPAVADADVWLLQEVVKPGGAAESVAAELAAALGASYVFAPADGLGSGKPRWGQATLSRYPLQAARVRRLAHHGLKFNTRCRIALEVTVMAPGGPIRVVNVHLDTRISKDERVAQVEPIIQASRDWPGPVVIGGDFNTANIRWLWNMLPIPYGQNQREPLKNAFRSHGFYAAPYDTRGTFKILWIDLHLDWIFSRGLTPLASGVADVRFSDHEAAWVRLSRTGSN